VCGICGIVSAERGVDPNELAAMNAKLAHRGPDSEGTFLDGGVGIAARRLSIIDLETGNQPLANEDGRVRIAQNGEIYNYRELRAELAAKGHRFTSHGDTEVIAHLYEEYGLDFAARLRGMFALAIWDANERRLILARDRFGIKPLYYRLQGDELRFAS
jgi:asparagine synthase (glutamine-hydrolysing)